jgi:hypothetical protein
MRSLSCESGRERDGDSRGASGEVRRRALRALMIMALASSPLIWVKLRLVTGIPRMAYASEVASPTGADTVETVMARVD